MVPASIHVVNAFPLTPSGKADRAALLERARELLAAVGLSAAMHKPAPWSDLSVRASAQPSARLGLLLLLRLSRPWA